MLTRNCKIGVGNGINKNRQQIVRYRQFFKKTRYTLDLLKFCNDEIETLQRRLEAVKLARVNYNST